MPNARLSAWTTVAIRVVVACCAIALLAPGALIDPGAARATALGDQIASGRRSQAYYEAAMLAQDRAVASLKQQSRETRRSLRDAKQAATRSKVALNVAIDVVQQRVARLTELEVLYAGVTPEEVPEGYADRLREARRDLAQAQRRRAALGQRFRSVVRLREARQRRLVSLKRSVRLAVSRRESAEAGLGAYIVRMTGLAAQRAELQSDAWLSTSSGFTWPAVGRISQTYGCTGFRLNPPRGSCRHFHDGLDIVAGHGSRVATAADGVVAYAGWNPWDERGRAWLMVVSHPDGYVTRYGHLLPGPIARVGQFVRQGQAIGRMGNTGRSTGTHLHFELLRGGSTVSPWTYLPAGMVTVREPRRGDRRDHDKDTSRRGHHKRPDKGKADRKAIRSEADPWAGLIDEGQAGLTVTGSVFNRSALDGEADVCQSLLPPGDDPGAAGTDPGPLPGSGQDGSSAPVPGMVELCATLEALPAQDSTGADVPPPAGAAYRRPAAGPASPSGVGPGVPRSLRGTSPVPL